MKPRIAIAFTLFLTMALGLAAPIGVGYRNYYVQTTQELTNTAKILQNNSILTLANTTFTVSPKWATTNGVVFINAVTNLIIQGLGWGSRVVAGNNGTIFVVTNCENVVFRDLSVEYAARYSITNGYMYAPIELRGSGNNFTFDKVRILNSGNHGINSGNCEDIDGLTFNQCHFENGGAFKMTNSPLPDGAAIVARAKNIRVLNCSFKNNVRDVEFENQNWDKPIANATCIGNSHFGTRDFCYAIFPHPTHQVKNVTISSCVASNLNGWYDATYGSWIIYPTFLYMEGGENVTVQACAVAFSGLYAGKFVSIGSAYGNVRGVSIGNNSVRYFHKGVHAIQTNASPTYSIEGLLVGNNHFSDGLLGGAGDPMFWIRARNVKLIDNFIVDPSPQGSVFYVQAGSRDVEISRNSTRISTSITVPHGVTNWYRYPTFYIYVDATVTNSFYENNIFEGLLNNATTYASSTSNNVWWYFITNRSPTTSYPSMIVGSNAPHASYDICATGSTYIARNSGLFYTFDGSSWGAGVKSTIVNDTNQSVVLGGDLTSISLGGGLGWILYDPADNGLVLSNGSTSATLALVSGAIYGNGAGLSNTLQTILTNTATYGANLSMARETQSTNITQADTLTFVGLTGLKQGNYQETRLLITCTNEQTITIPNSWRTPDGNQSIVLNASSNAVLRVERWGAWGPTNAEFTIFKP